MNTIQCKDIYSQFHCPIDLEYEIRDDKKFLTKLSLEHLEEHLLPDHKELKEQEEKTQLVENYI